MLGFVAKGSKENFLVDLVDRTGVVTDLSGSGPTFDVIDSTDTYKVTAGSASASGMRITALVDTNVGGIWDVGEYRFFVKFTVGAQVIRKGPYYFQIIE